MRILPLCVKLFGYDLGMKNTQCPPPTPLQYHHLNLQKCTLSCLSVNVDTTFQLHIYPFERVVFLLLSKTPKTHLKINTFASGTCQHFHKFAKNSNTVFYFILFYLRNIVSLNKLYRIEALFFLNILLQQRHECRLRGEGRRP